VRRRAPVRLHQGAVPGRDLHSHAVLPVANPYSVLPVAALPVAVSSGLHHSVLPVSAVERHHPVLPRASSRIPHHSVVPIAAFSGIRHPVAAVKLQHTILPLPAAARHTILPVAAFRLLDSSNTRSGAVLPVAAVRLIHANNTRAGTVLPVTTLRLLHSGNTRPASANLRRRAGRAVRAAAALARPQPVNAPVPRLVSSSSLHRLLRPAARGVAAQRAPRLRPAAARPGDAWGPLAVDAAARLRAAVSEWQRGW
jgi:hypothetical protein